MNCEEYRDEIPSYIKKELTGEQRIQIKNHLHSCTECRENYLSQLKMSYIIDHDSIMETVPESAVKSFKYEVLEHIEDSSQKRTGDYRWLWYSAAAILIFGILIGRFMIPDKGNQALHSSAENKTLSQLIFSEDWSRLEVVLSDKNEFSKYSTDAIPIHILLEKLLTLQKMGIRSLPVVDRDVQSKEQSSDGDKDDTTVQISLDDFIRLLEDAKLQRTKITLNEVSKLLTNI